MKRFVLNIFIKKSENPFVIYADFESILVNVDDSKILAPIMDVTTRSYTRQYQNHEICSKAYKVVCCIDDKFTKPIKMYPGEDAVYKFIEDILAENNEIQKIMKAKFNKPMKMTSDDKESFKATLVAAGFVAKNM